MEDNKLINFRGHIKTEDLLKCAQHDRDTQITETKEVVIYEAGMDPFEVYTKGVDTVKGRKYDQGKPRHDLYPVDALEGCTKVLTFGAEKYAPNEWKLVPDAKNRYYSAMMRHVLAQKKHTDAGNSGLAVDEESGLPHLDHAQCCLIFLRELSK